MCSYSMNSDIKQRYCIAIESSCDDTGIACLNLKGEVVFNEKISQTDIHAQYGGVVPEVASRNHIISLQKISEKLKQVDPQSIEMIAATTGPGLVGGLISGIMFSKGLADSINKPFYAINHLEGHLLSANINSNSDRITFPCLMVLISGGHCQIIVAHNLGKYEVVSQTVDDSAGEAFDKIGRMLDMDYPAGPEIDQRAQLGSEDQFKFTVPKVRNDEFAMSFSGLKTNVLRTIAALPKPLTQFTINNMCASVQHTITAALTIRIRKVIEKYKDTIGFSQLVLAGGVAANSSVRDACVNLANDYHMTTLMAQLQYCTDNAAMIGMAAIEKYKYGILKNTSTKPRPRWSLESLES